ncbi:sulfur carrier protein ThiS [Gordonia polyisoprenivorans]|uniref:sulfur carrier protein ThiS n=1 Tax=Gordonia polyisoprenivorans TaxID=84595 RepID=UPI001AD734F0|nr:sulfur carrier protein ThiS [Gordonia polyisoprenivorans]QTI70104.1 sulfur carrier protein ThiS [Gordonia polyisoprenivorans]
MTITVNGTDSPLRPGGSVRDLLASMGLPDKGIAVAVDGTVVPRSRWDTVLDDGATVEVVTAVQGG